MAAPATSRFRHSHYDSDGFYIRLIPPRLDSLKSVRLVFSAAPNQPESDRTIVRYSCYFRNALKALFFP